MKVPFMWQENALYLPVLRGVYYSQENIWEFMISGRVCLEFGIFLQFRALGYGNAAYMYVDVSPGQLNKPGPKLYRAIGNLPSLQHNA